MSAEQNTTAARLDAWLAATGRGPTPDGPVDLPLLTGSMAPAIPAGALLHINVPCDRPLRPGDVAVFLVGGRLVAHRVLLVLRAGPWHLLLEMGDANATGRWRRGDLVTGRVTGFTLPGGPVQGDPGAPHLASAGLRRHLLHLLRHPSAWRPVAEED